MNYHISLYKIHQSNNQISPSPPKQSFQNEVRYPLHGRLCSYERCCCRKGMSRLHQPSLLHFMLSTVRWQHFPQRPENTAILTLVYNRLAAVALTVPHAIAWRATPTTKIAPPFAVFAATTPAVPAVKPEPSASALHQESDLPRSLWAHQRDLMAYLTPYIRTLKSSAAAQRALI